MKQGIFFEAGEGLEVSARGSRMFFKAIAETTENAFSLMERELPVGNRRPQPHTHAGTRRLLCVGRRDRVPRRRSRPRRRTRLLGACSERGCSHLWQRRRYSGPASDHPRALPRTPILESCRNYGAKKHLPSPEEERELMKRHGLKPVVSES